MFSYGFAPGERMQDAAFVDDDGRAGRLSTLAGTRGTVIVIRDAECPVSQRYAPRLAQLEKEYGAKGFAFTYVDLTPHSRADAKADAAHYGLTGRTILDDHMALASLLRAASTAEVFVIDIKGTIRYRGAIDDQYGVTYHRDSVSRPWLRSALDAVARGDEPRVTRTDAPGCLLPVDFAAVGTALPVTYHNRVSRIVESNCQSCHRQGGLAPMPFETYQQVADRRAMIATVVRSGRMPPWSASKEVGEFANDRRLSDRDRTDLLAWADAGAPEGNPAEAPLPRKWTAGWNIGQPDAVVPIPEAIKVPAQGVVAYKYVYVKTDFSTDKWITAVEVHPTAPRVVHHVLVFLEAPRDVALQNRKPGDPPLPPPTGGIDGFFAATAPGSTGIVFPLGTGKRLPKGAWLKLQIHYQPNGSEQLDQTEIGFKFSDTPLEEVQSLSANNVRFVIPPNDPHFEVKATYVFKEAGQLLSLFPHMHLRGSAFRFDLQYPDGHVVPVLDVPHFDFNWQSYYELKTPLDIPAGAKLLATAWYDNSAANPFNPDPTKTVRFGEQTFEEMMIGYFDFKPARRMAAPVAPAPGTGGR